MNEGSIVYCDVCDRRVDTEEDEGGARDIDAGVYSCSECQQKSAENLGFAVLRRPLPLS